MADYKYIFQLREHTNSKLSEKKQIILKEINLEKIIEIAREAGESILDVYNSEDFGVETKSDNSPLTKADKASDEIIEKRLNEFYPEIPILSEEGKNVSFG